MRRLTKTCICDLGYHPDTPLTVPPPRTPECEPHTPHPAGYVAHSDWADMMMTTHEPRQCRGCGLWAIWEPKGTDAMPDEHGLVSLRSDDPARYDGPVHDADDGAAVPAIDPATATRAERVAWCKARAAGEPWHLAWSSMIQDMQVMGIPFDAETILLGMQEAVTGGEAAVRRFIDTIS